MRFVVLAGRFNALASAHRRCAWVLVPLLIVSCAGSTAEAQPASRPRGQESNEARPGHETGAPASDGRPALRRPAPRSKRMKAGSSRVWSIQKFRRVLTNAVAAASIDEGVKRFKERFLTSSAMPRLLLLTSTAVSEAEDLLSTYARTCAQARALCVVLHHDDAPPEILKLPRALEGDRGIAVFSGQTKDLTGSLRRTPLALVFDADGRGVPVDPTNPDEVLEGLGAVVSVQPSEVPEKPKRVQRVDRCSDVQRRVLRINGERVPICPRKRKQRPLLLVYWATWCSPCIEEMPTVRLLHRAFKRDVEFKAVAMQAETTADTRRLVQAIARKHGIEFPQYIEEEVAGTYQEVIGDGGAVPAHALFSRSGRLIEAHKGKVSDQGTLDRLERELSRMAKKARRHKRRSSPGGDVDSAVK